jgi:hypothetical protein
MVMLQAFVDDSVSQVGDKRLFLAAYINTADRWAAFSDEWSETLRTPPAIEYFKMAEAQNLRDQFRGWPPEERDKKVLALAALIQKYRCWSAHCSVSSAEYAAIIAPVAPMPLKSPYFACFWGLIDTVARNHHQLVGSAAPPVDFIFDQQEGSELEASIWYDWLKDNGKELEIKRLLGATPIFRDDKQVLPLQAADMLAWHVRRFHERGDENRPAFDLVVADGQHVYRHFDEVSMRGTAQFMAGVPGIDRVQSKKEWRLARDAAVALRKAGQWPYS